jgi:hypothetical protein
VSDRHNGDLGRRLRGERPEPRDEFVSSLAQRVRAEPTVRRAGWRVAFAGGFTALLVIAFALTGGISYAAKSIHGGTTAVTHLVTGPPNAGQANDKADKGNKGENGNKSDNGNKSSDTSTDTTSSEQTSSQGGNGNGNNGNGNASKDTDPSAQASPQSEGRTTVCHVPPGNPDNPQTISVGNSSVPDHLANHPGDSLGPCEEDGGSGGDQYGEKVLICHIPPGNPEHPITISVSQNAVPAHLAHGDTEGPCPEDD